MKLELNLDVVGYDHKPTSTETAGIRKRLPGWKMPISPEELIDAIGRGTTFTPGRMLGTSGDTWQSQQVICADIDNGNKATGQIANPLTPAEALAFLEGKGITPYFCYQTFSYKPEWEKFRVVCILPEKLTDPEKAVELTRKLANALNEYRPGCTDTSIRDNARLLFGGRPGCVFAASKQLTPISALEALPDVKAPERERKEPERPAQAHDTGTGKDKSMYSDRDRFRDEVGRRWREIIPHFCKPAKDQANGETSYICPFCKHGQNGDGLTFDKTDPDGTRLKCFGKCTDDDIYWSEKATATGTGDIFDIVQKVRGVGYPEALRICADVLGLDVPGSKKDAAEPPKEEVSKMINAVAIKSGKECIFVVDDELDVSAIREAGHEAIGLNGPENIGTFVKVMNRHKPDCVFLIALDDRRGGGDLMKALSENGITHMKADILNGCKTASQALGADREKFLSEVNRAAKSIDRPDNTALYIDTLMGDDIEKYKSTAKTGFPILDRITGGLYGGLYVLAAITSLGKTSFALQMADQIAASGQDVVFFSLEQSRLEMVSKSLAREIAKVDPFTKTTSLAIRQNRPTREVASAAERYKKAVGSRMSMVEGNFRTKVSDIRDYVRSYEKRTGVRPVVFVDYLQILRPEDNDKKQTVRETVDGAVEELKMLSRDDNLTIFVISSVNRANYTTPISFESLKESGGIEYSCDCLWGLQLQCLEGEDFKGDGKVVEKRKIIEEAKDEEPRRVQLKCLKNRYGRAHFDCFYNYYPASDLFQETKEATYKPAKKPARGRK